MPAGPCGAPGWRLFLAEQAAPVADEQQGEKNDRREERDALRQIFEWRKRGRERLAETDRDPDEETKSNKDQNAHNDERHGSDVAHWILEFVRIFGHHVRQRPRPAMNTA